MNHRIGSAMWRDPTFGGLSAAGKLVWAYLLSGPQRSLIPGLFRFSREAAGEDLGLGPEDLARALAELADAGLTRVDGEPEVVWIPSALADTPPSTPTFVRAWRRDWQSLPDTELCRQARQGLIEQLSALGEPFAAAAEDALGPRRPRPGANGRAQPRYQEFFADIAKSLPADRLVDDPGELKEYGTDWVRAFAPDPCAVAFPRSTQEVATVLRLCSRYHIPVVPSGGRTGMSAGAYAGHKELVLSLDKMNGMGEVDETQQTVRVQAGAVTEAVHKHCAPHGLTWPVDLAAKGSCQVGGNISTNAGGLNVVRYGNARYWVLGLQVVTMSGEILELNGALEKNNTGIDLRQMFIGTEGTLGVITEATLKLTRLVENSDVFFFALADWSAVLGLLREARKSPFTVLAFECLMENCIQLMTTHRDLPRPFPEPSDCYVVMEVEQPSSADAKEAFEAWMGDLFERELVLNGVVAQNTRERRNLWALREGMGEALQMRGKGVFYENDVSVPISSLEPFVADILKEVAGREDLETYVYGHIGDGNLHIVIPNVQGYENEHFMQLCQDADQAIFRLVQRYRGSISAEHGIGLVKKAALPFCRSPVELELFRQIKRVFDPSHLLNPGKIID